MRKRGVICALLMLGLVFPASAASSRSDDISRIQQSADVFKDIVDAPDSSFPLDLLQSAQCIAIIPAVLKEIGRAHV